MTGTHTRYAIRTKNGWVGHRHYTYAAGSQSSDHAKPENARLYTRKGDAERAAVKGEEVVPVTVTM